jgi:hypothetical protein
MKNAKKSGGGIIISRGGVLVLDGCNVLVDDVLWVV